MFFHSKNSISSVSDKAFNHAVASLLLAYCSFFKMEGTHSIQLPFSNVSGKAHCGHEREFLTDCFQKF